MPVGIGLRAALGKAALVPFRVPGIPRGAAKRETAAERRLLGWLKDCLLVFKISTEGLTRTCPVLFRKILDGTVPKSLRKDVHDCSRQASVIPESPEVHSS